MEKTKFKALYTFSVPVIKEVEEKTERVNEAGETVTETKKVKKPTPRQVALRRPTRALLDDAELYFNVMVSKGIQAGLMSRALLAKRFNNDGGVISEPEKQAYAKAYYELEQKQSELVRLTSLKDEANLSDGEKAHIKKLVEETGLLRRSLQDWEVAQLSLYDITAESRARTKTILWWTLQLAYMRPENDSDTWEPIFKGETFEEKMNSYDFIEEGDGIADEQKEFFFKAIRRAAAATAFWFYGRASKQEDFRSLETEINRDLSEPEPEQAKEGAVTVDKAVEPAPDTTTVA